MKRVISILLVALMLFGMLPSTAVHSHADEGTWTLVTDVNTLAEGDQVVIAASGSNYALGTTQNTNNRVAASITKLDNNTITIGNSVQILTLKTGTVAGTWAFYTGSGYLYAASSSKNYLRTQSTNNDNGSWSVSITNGVATIKAQGSNTRNLIKKNSTDALFSCYSGGQADVALYKLITETACEHTNTTTTTVDATCTEDGSVTVTCDDCGETVSTETIDALGHNYQLVGGSYVCQNNCGIDVASYTVSFSVPAGVSAIDSLTTDMNGQVTLPSAGVPTGEHTYTFAGWTTGMVEDSTTAPTIYEADDSFTPQDDITLKAVYTYTVAGEGGGNGNYVKVTEEPDDWSGDYLIVYETSDYIFNGSLASFDAVNNYKTVTITNNTISASEGDPYKFTITPSGTGYAIQGTSGGYIGHGSNANGLTTGASALVNSISLDKDGNANIVGSAGAYLRFNSSSDQTRFRYFKSSTYTSQKAIALYVKQSSTETTYYTTEIVAAACDHVWDSGVQSSAPSCDVAGLMTYTCTLCSETKTEAIDAWGHTEGTPVTENEVEASCEENGSYDTVVYCSVCDKELSRFTTTVEATGHNFSGGVCTECGAVDESAGVAYVLVTDVNDLKVGDQIVIVAQDADYAMSATQGSNNRTGVTVTKNTIDNKKTVEFSDDVQVLTLQSGNVDGTFAFYTGSGYLYAASSSGNYLRTETSLSNNSSWTIEIDAEGAATVNAQGSNSRNCMRFNPNNGSPLFACYASGQQDIAIYKKTILCAHTNTTEVAQQDPTCTAVGYTAGVYCNDCENYISGHEVIDMIDHSWNDGVETTAPGCETTGVKTYTCSVCGETKTEEIAATGHTMNEGVVIDPTCENAGSKTYTCTVCGKEQVETIAALGHNWGEGKVVTAATCDAAGEMSYTCGNDPSHTKTEEIPALGHKWGAGVETTAATCDTAGIMTYTCETDPSHTKTEAIPALGHNYGDDNICDNCGKEIGYFQHITDYTKILAGGEYVIAAKSGDTFYALGTDVDSEPTAYEVAVVGTGANMIIQYADTVPIWNIEYFMHKTNCVALSANGSYLKGTDSTSFGNNDSTPWAWTFADVENDAQATPDEEYAVQKEDGSVAYVLVSESISDRAISYANDVFKNYSIRNDYNRELYFFKMVEADATEYTATFVENGITTMTQTVSADENVVKMPQPTSDTLPEGYTKFVGWVTLPHSESLIAPSVIYSAEEGDGHNNTMALTENTTFYALYSREDFNAEGQAMSYHLVTNQNQLVVGQNYIIVGLHTDGNYYAMSVKQLSDDRGASPVTPDAEGAITFVPQDQIAVFQLQHGYEIGSFAFLDLAMNKFLYCASSSENSLNSQDTLDEAASFTITVHDETDGHYSVMLDGLYGNRLMFNNSHTSSSDRFFSCYGPNSSIKEENTFLYVGVPNTTSATYYTTGLCAHDWVQTAEVEANCEHAGYTQFTCFICGEIKLEDVQAHGHNVGDQIITTNPTCTTTGLATSTCTNCGKTFEEVIPATGHTEVTDAAVAPTCTETGLTEGVHCAVCDAVLIPQVTVSANGHNYGEWTVDVKPTFTDPGTQHQLCPNCNEVHTEEIAQLPFPVYSYGVTLGNSIGETFLIDPAYTQDATVTFTVAGKTYTYAVQSMDTVYDEDKDIYYPTASIPLASGQMTDAIHVVIVSPENGTATKDYTVYEYAQYILNGEYSEKTKTLVREMLNYGNYAQIYFEYNMDDLANKDLDPVTPAEMPALDANNNKAEQTDNAENVDFFGCSLVHWFQTSINFYFKFSGNIESYEFSANGEILTPEVKGNMCFVTVAGFNPQNLSEDVTIIVNDGTGELSVTYSPMDYITRMYYNGSAPVELKNLVQAMYGYHLAAVAYKTNSES